MANKTVYPYGTDGILPASIGIINDLRTGGADKALAAEQGKVLNEKLYGTFAIVETKADADIYRVLAGQESPYGTRIRVILPVTAGMYVETSCSQGKGVAVNIYDTVAKCMKSDTDYLETLSNGYKQTVTATIHYDGYLCVTLAKSNDSSFSDSDMTTFINALELSVYGVDEVGDIEKLQNQISELGETPVPDYWKTYLDAKLPSIKSDYLFLGMKGIAFSFITDTHWDDNRKKSPLVIKYIQDKVGITDCIFGGDVVTAHGTRADKLAEIYGFMDAMKFVSPVVLVGNHDYNTSNQTTTEQTYLTDANLISPGEFYRLCNVPKENIVHYTGVAVSGQFDEYFGYRDNESQKIRYIFLDSGAVYKPNWADTNLRLSNDQVNWMKDRITELPSGWGVIVFTHIFFNPASTPTVHGIGTQIETALDSIYDTANATIIGVVCGHIHRSYSKTSAKGYPIIATTTDSAGQSNSEGISYTPGTATEQAFDLYFVNTEDRTIKVVRIGAGDTAQDRTFTY